MTAAVLIKNGRAFINLGHWGNGDWSRSCYRVGPDRRERVAFVVLSAQVIWAVVEHTSMRGLM